MDKKKIWLVAGVVVLAVLIIAAVAFGLYQFQQPRDLGDGWVYKHSNLCNVDIPVPPRKGQYLSAQGEYWRFEENAMTQGNPFFPNIALSMFQNPQASGTDYVAAAVLVSCKPNPNHDSNEVLADKYAQYLLEMNKDALDEAKITFTQLGTEKNWDRDVLVISMRGGIFNSADRLYLFSTPQMSYLISKPHMSTDQFLGQTTEEIFSKLKFR